MDMLRSSAAGPLDRFMGMIGVGWLRAILFGDTSPLGATVPDQHRGNCTGFLPCITARRYKTEALRCLSDGASSHAGPLARPTATTVDNIMLIAAEGHGGEVGRRTPPRCHRSPPRG